ncbi:hypothetical protein OG271_03765 [Micromonospora rifamycinica]|uniref:hypothetical protein n=1 Tax=Micromonospora rifamycinica TaxID=291594 RepID=UPI002E2C0AC7|nr:hypothetical protein [Micromonospora rifamycinica]
MTDGSVLTGDGGHVARLRNLHPSAPCGVLSPSMEGGEKVTTYPGGGQVDAAQVALERHAVSSADGRCLGCGALGPCTTHEQAMQVFRFALRLPKRVPGATRPELIGARRVGVPALLAVK